MKFYRLAKLEDFEKAEKDHSDLPQEAKDILSVEEDRGKAYRCLYKTYGYSMQQARRECDAYLAFLRARSDYLLGKPVYTGY